jgi:4-azaleucine resistance transporter AzlC
MLTRTDPPTYDDLPFTTTSESFRQGVIASLPTVLGYCSIGFAAGSIGALAGFSIIDIALLSAFLYAGSAQFIVYSLHSAGAGVPAVVMGVLLINMRFLAMSSYMAMYFTRRTLIEKLIGGALLTDATFGVAAQFASRYGTLPFAWLLGLNLAAWLSWVIANLTGAALAASLPERLTKGLGFSLVAMFIGLLLMLWFGSRKRHFETATIVTAMVVVVLTSPHLERNASVLLAAIIAATATTLLMRARKRGAA